MRRGDAVAIAAAFVTAALLYTAIASRKSLDTFRSRRRNGGEIRLRTRPSLGGGMLSVAGPAPSPRGSPSTVPAIRPSEEVAVYPPDSLCGFYGSLWTGSASDFDRRLEDAIVSVGKRDGSIELFMALARGDFAEIAELARTGRSPEADEIAFLARTDLLDHSKNLGPRRGEASLDPRELDEIEEFRRRDPQNSFWPLLEAYLKRKENVPDERATLLAEAASLPGYRNPIASFYGGVRRSVLDSGDDRAFMAYLNLETRVTMIRSDFYASLSDEAGKSAETDEMLKWIGKTIERSQMPDPDNALAPPIDGIQGSFMDAYRGRLIAGSANGDRRSRREIYRSVSDRFSLSRDADLIGSTMRKGCDDAAIEGYFSELRRRVGWDYGSR